MSEKTIIHYGMWKDIQITEAAGEELNLQNLAMQFLILPDVVQQISIREVTKDQIVCDLFYSETPINVILSEIYDHHIGLEYVSVPHKCLPVRLQLIQNSTVISADVIGCGKMNVLNADFIERHVSSLTHVPLEWTVGSGTYYQLNLRMCQITALDYNFQWGKMPYGIHSVLDHPKKILRLDISLNDIVSLEHKQLAPLSQLRVLNASLNRIERYPGIETLKLLAFLDLSHNNIKELHGLHGCITLKMVNFAANHIEDISCMPSLVQLRELHLNNNILKSLDGIQALPLLQELYVQRNLLTDIVPLASSFHLHILNAADNNLKSFKETVEILQDLKNLHSVVLQGNPIEQEPDYKAKLIAATEITLLDNVEVSHQPKYQIHTMPNHSLNSLKNATREAFLDHLLEIRQNMEENIRFLQRRIQILQKDFRDYEISAMSDLEACLRYMDTLSLDDAQKYSSEFLKDRIPFGQPIPFTLKHHQKLDRDHNGVALDPRPGGIISPAGNKHLKGDYKDVKDTDEVLRCVYNELARKQEDD